MVTLSDICVLSAIVSVVEAIALAAVSFTLVKSQRRSASVVSDLMDRLMSRNFQEYSALRVSSAPRKVKRPPLTDSEMAEIERLAREASGGGG